MKNHSGKDNDLTAEACLNEINAWADVFNLSVNSLTLNESEQFSEEKLDKKRRWLDDIAVSTFYALKQASYNLTEFAFFIVSDDWDEQSLIRLKDNTGASLLLGLQTDLYYNNFNVTDSIINCTPDEVQQVMKMFEVLSNRRNDLVAIDFNFVKEALENTEPAQFVQAITFSSDRLDRTEQAIAKVLKQIPENANINTLILSVKSYDCLSLENFSIINTAVDNRVTEDTNIWYGTGIIDEPNCCHIEGVYWIE